MPGQPVRARARFQFPPAIHPRELPAATGVTAIIVRQALRFTTFSLKPLSGRTLRSATEKHFPLVQKLWTTGLPCGSLRKTAQESRHHKCRPRLFNNLDAVKEIVVPFSRSTPPGILQRIPECCRCGPSRSSDWDRASAWVGASVSFPSAVTLISKLFSTQPRSKNRASMARENR
jgi:hypothetical protein